jgi:hypothetical protein
MAITIGSNNLTSNTASIEFQSNNNFVQEVNQTVGRRTQYPMFSAACTFDAWRYAGQLGCNQWREVAGWGVGGSWSVTQRGAGSFGFQTSTGRYFAPVSGYYKFGMTMYYLDDGNTYHYTHVNFGKNGGLNYNNGRHGHSIFNYPSHGSYAHGINMENIIYCDQGQYISPQPYWNCGNQRIYCGHFNYYGHLCP